MKTSGMKNCFPPQKKNYKRREFLKKSTVLAGLTGVTGLGLMTGCKGKAGTLTPSEALMRQHGLLDRIILIYDTCRMHLINGVQFPVTAVYNSAWIIRTFVEEYHEQMEEKYLFPLFAKANKMVDLVQLLFIQHNAARKLTDEIIETGEMESLTDETTQKLIKLIDDFNTMYRPHKAWEDTVLLPALRKIVPEDEYLDLAGDFEKKGHESLGEEGFETTLEKVAAIEKQLGINDLTKFTPDI